MNLLFHLLFPTRPHYKYGCPCTSPIIRNINTFTILKLQAGHGTDIDTWPGWVRECWFHIHGQATYGTRSVPCVMCRCVSVLFLQQDLLCYQIPLSPFVWPITRRSRYWFGQTSTRSRSWLWNVPKSFSELIGRYSLYFIEDSLGYLEYRSCQT